MLRLIHVSRKSVCRPSWRHSTRMRRRRGLSYASRIYIQFSFSMQLHYMEAETTVDHVQCRATALAIDPCSKTSNIKAERAHTPVKKRD